MKDMREIATNCTCERCNLKVQVKPKKIGKMYFKGKYPQGWSKPLGETLCEQCSTEFTSCIAEFMNGGKKK